MCEERLRKEPAYHALRNVGLQDLSLSLLILVKCMITRLDPKRDDREAASDHAHQKMAAHKNLKRRVIMDNFLVNGRFTLVSFLSEKSKRGVRRNVRVIWASSFYWIEDATGNL